MRLRACTWPRIPVADAAQIDDSLSVAARLAMRVSSLGRSARSKAGIKVRQPLTRVLVKPRTQEEAAMLDADNAAGPGRAEREGGRAAGG